MRIAIHPLLETVMSNPHSPASPASPPKRRYRPLLGALLSFCAIQSAAAQSDASWSTFNSVSMTRLADGTYREHLVKNGRIYVRTGRQHSIWADISDRFNGTNQVGEGEITSFDYEVHATGFASMQLVRGGHLYRSEEFSRGRWTPWENADSDVAGTGRGRITSFSALHAPDITGAGPGTEEEYVVRNGTIHKRERPVGTATWGPWLVLPFPTENAGYPNDRSAVRSYHIAYEANGEPIEYLARQSTVYRMSDADFETWWDVTGEFLPAGREPDSNVHAPIYKRVLLLEFNPRMASHGGKPLNVAMNWKNPRALADEYIRQMESVTDHVVQYAIADSIRIEAFPRFSDGPSFGETEYLGCVSGNTCRKMQFDYRYYLDKAGLCSRANAGEFDEVWLMGGAHFGFLESTMVGIDAFGTNGPAIRDTDCIAKLNIMGFSYQRDIPEMLENMGHRVQGTMQQAFGGWRNANDYANPPMAFPRDANPLERFTARGFDRPVSACGNIHGFLNSPNWIRGVQRDWTNAYFKPNQCDDWERYPGLTGATTNNNCARWNCTDLGWKQYWLGKVPAFVGETQAGRNNWWAYVLDSSLVK